jgi:DNA-binding transcriptional LysR family regulator
VLIHGQALVCVPRGNPLAALDEVRTDELVGQPFILMRPGYLMHRVIHRLLDGDPAPSAYVADGAEMGKLLVAEGDGVTVLPDFSVIGDPCTRRG